MSGLYLRGVSLLRRRYVPTTRRGGEQILTRIRTLIPVFAGTTKDGERVELYKQGEVYHLRHPKGGGEIWALSRCEITMFHDQFTHTTHMTLSSPEWTGDATGTYKDLMEMEALH